MEKTKQHRGKAFGFLGLVIKRKKEQKAKVKKGVGVTRAARGI